MRVSHLLAGILILATALAINPSLVTKLDANIYVTGELEVNGDIQYIDLNLTIPQNTTNQLSLCNATLIDVDGIKMAHLHFENPSSTIRYKIVCQVETGEQVTTSLPKNYNTDEYHDYTLPSEGVPSDDPQIKELAESIVAGSASDFEKLAKLTRWVHNYITYDESVTGEYLDTYTILSKRRGVCVEYATLFVTLARALGYPTRFVGGIAYGDQGPTGHMWAEVYLGKWVPFDPTWNLGGSLDATHIPFYKTRYRAVESKIKYAGTGGYVSWKTTTSEDSFNSGLGDIIINYMETGDYPVKYKTYMPAKKIGFSSSTFVLLNLTTDRYLVVPITLTECSGSEDIVEIPNKTVTISLEPNVPKLVYWKVYSNKLDPKYIYTCPLTVNSAFLETSSLDVQILSMLVPSFEVSVSNSKPILDENFYAYIESKNPLKFYGVYDNQLEVGYGTDVILGFTADKLGTSNLVVTSSKGGLVEVLISTSAPEGLSISRVLYPKAIMMGQTGTIQVLLSNPSKTAVPVTLSLTHNGRTTKMALELSENKLVSFNVTFNTPGYHQLVIELEGGGVYDRKTAMIKVVEKPDITLTKQQIVGDFIILDFNVSGDPVNPQITIDGKPYPFSEHFKARLDSGKHLISITWEDELGNTYKKEMSIDIQSSEISNLNMFMLIFILLLAVALVLVIIAILLIVKTKPKMAQ